MPAPWTSDDADRIELAASTGTPLIADERPRMDELPPVRLVAVEDVRLPMPPGLEAKLDAFYVGLLQFRREGAVGAELVYRAENARLRLTPITHQRPIERDGVRPQGIQVPSLSDAERKLVEAEIEYDRQRGLGPGQLTLLARDPAGNWVELFDATQVA